ncbi:hypothetical protein AGABI2DRAFT_65585 [Agaricus bisporus var. bisporus H97]|uniref:hypothetical protein n=1 Tax=Agaricus bisporus var. bisporus (strain H97 / ATCC MYA-4626 / FGSC 10389) TaxID=936046 RepID=UPI00029F77F0|nr:hypothetical protein AGABI2DRAFT_65585 [Agaricus bisporus var. bisporus H97]EKV49276.1 hypothetical protein AGABI2DRAFT_65585 [Agaricus bisporus var. bisporus H97]
MGGGAASEFFSPSGHSDTRAPSDVGAYPGAPPPYPPPHDQSQGFQPPPVDFKSPPQFAPPPPQSSQAPPSGYRVPLRTDSAFASAEQCGPPIAYDADGVSPIFIGSALFESSVQPCKIGPHLQPTPVALAYGGREVSHDGRYDLLPFVPDQMEWVPAQYGQIPPGRRPVEGGYEENGGKLYHAMANVNGVRVPGKTGDHLGAANIPFGGQEHAYQQYEIL